MLWPDEWNENYSNSFCATCDGSKSTEMAARIQAQIFNISLQDTNIKNKVYTEEHREELV